MLLMMTQKNLSTPFPKYDDFLRRYVASKHNKFGLCASAITFCLKSCISLGTLEFGRVVHVDSIKLNFNSDCFVGSSLIKFYSQYGKIKDAHKVFDEITNKDIVAYTSMITAYAHSGGSFAYGAFNIACTMQQQGMLPNRVTLVSLMHAAAKLGALQEGRVIHGYAVRRGIGLCDDVFETTLLDMYHKCGGVGLAASVFAKMDARKTINVGSWNSLMAAYLHNGQALEAFELFRRMMCRNVLPDLLTLANAIFSCVELNYLRRGMSIHGYMITMGVELDLVASTALVDLYCKLDVTKARKLFERLGNKDAVVYNVMMTGYLENEFLVEAVNVFREMVKVNVSPNVALFLNLISAVSKLRDIKLARSIHGYVLRHMHLSHLEIANQIIHAYSKCGYVMDARKVFNRMRTRDLVSWTSMITGYVHNGHIDEAINLFRLLQRENLNIDSVTLIGLLQALSQLGCLRFVKEVHCFSYRFFHGRELSVNNSLITIYAKCGKLCMARYIFQQMTERCLTSWNAMIGAYAMHGNYTEVLELFDHMKFGKITPDEVTFTSILTACSHSGLVEKGLQIFGIMMKEYAIVPSEVHYSCIVDLLSRAGRLREAYNLVKTMPSTHSSAALSSLLSACRLYGDTEIGEAIGKHILKLEPYSSGAHALVSNIRAQGGRWDEVAQIRAMTKNTELRSTAGYSACLD
ncbi:pentatricopeptide repeat-containing protein at4g21300-like protein [Trifolium pratense]|uniref:Pentatricopeptide repeat-containing protein at4g21300-like protein n=1 Tax=Trifolium pratense TaxID=57577 RepID=A0A2K3NJC0_TRIPR|nr:pentatricopeptide repeat-containing protein at4g21300-like protein [Trifolium pratense]